MPFVGDAGLSILSGEMRPCEGDMANPRVSETASMLGGSNLCELVKGSGEPAPEFLEVDPGSILALDGGEPSVIWSGLEDSRDIPGICTRAEFDPWSDRSSSSTWYFL